MHLTKIAAILLLGIHLCSSICHSFVFNYFINLSDKQIVREIDNTGYNDAELVEIAIPLNMPYLVSRDNYERYDGSIEFNGTHYNYVKRKVSNDTLHLLCIANEQKTELYNAKYDYTKQLSDASSGKKSSGSSIKKSSFFSEYSNHPVQYNFTSIASVIQQNKACKQVLLADCFVDAPGKPPQVSI
ncbi:hypothetical protein BH10BAC2_BH10BAC2_25310 [soil metagenome]